MFVRELDGLMGKCKILVYLKLKVREEMKLRPELHAAEGVAVHLRPDGIYEGSNRMSMCTKSNQVCGLV